MLKKRKHFLNTNHRNQLFKTCRSCRDRHIARVRIEREAAHAVGLRCCTSGSHCVTVVACTSPAGILHASCLACHERRREAYAAHARAAAIDQNAGQDVIDDSEGVVTEPIVADEFGDDTEWMDVDLPGNCAVLPQEKITVTTNGSNTIAITVSVGSHCPQIARSYTAKN